MPDTKTKPTPEQKKLRTKLARTLWDVDVKDTDFPDMKARNEEFAEVRGAYRKRAAMVLRRLEKRGVTMILDPNAGADGDTDE